MKREWAEIGKADSLQHGGKPRSSIRAMRHLRNSIESRKFKAENK